MRVFVMVFGSVFLIKSVNSILLNWKAAPAIYVKKKINICKCLWIVAYYCCIYSDYPQAMSASARSSRISALDNMLSSSAVLWSRWPLKCMKQRSRSAYSMVKLDGTMSSPYQQRQSIMNYLFQLASSARYAIIWVFDAFYGGFYVCTFMVCGFLCYGCCWDWDHEGAIAGALQYRGAIVPWVLFTRWRLRGQESGG